MNSSTNSTIELEQVNERENQSQESSESVVYSDDRNVTNVSERFSPSNLDSVPNQVRSNRRRLGHYPNNRRHLRHQHIHRYTSADEVNRDKKIIFYFSVAHFLLGIFCVLVQMVQYTNHSALSKSQPGFWCGTFFVITGSVCLLGLTKITRLYSTVAMSSFSFISIFLAATLLVLGLVGLSGAECCQEYLSYNCESTSISLSFNTTRTTTTTLTSNSLLSTSTELTWITEETTSEGTCYPNAENRPYSCQDIKNGYCGYDIGLEWTLHLLLTLAGCIGSITSTTLFMYSICFSFFAYLHHNVEVERNRPRRSYMFVISRNDRLSTGGVTALEFPPPNKDVELATKPGIEERYLDEPPPPYVEQDNVELQSYL